MKGHIEVNGFNAQAAPANWYDNLTMTTVKWSDRATSSNASPTPGSEGKQSPSQAGAQWIRTGSSVPGQQWTWWDGTKYTNQYQ